VKIVLDTNVILAAFATRGLCEAVMTVCLDRHEIALCESILAETARHLAGKFRLPASRTDELVAFLREHAEMVAPAELPPDACCDPDDLAVLGAAVAANADCVVTGDKDLLSLGHYRGIPILTPRGFYDQLV